MGPGFALVFGSVPGPEDGNAVGTDRSLIPLPEVERRKVRGRPFQRPEEITIDLDATLLQAHSEKEDAAGNYKGGFGFHPLMAYLSETGEALAGLLRPGNAGANTAADHFEVLELTLEQIPTTDLDREILVRCDGAGASHAFTHDCREASIGFSVGYELSPAVQGAILEAPESAWHRAIQTDGILREGAWVIELTDSVDLSNWPEDTRLICRRERAHPGAQFKFTDHDGHRFTSFLTDTEGEGIAGLELRHRQRARIEDSIRCGKETGMRNLPFHDFTANQVWLELSLMAQDLLAWAKSLVLCGELARAEPKRLRQRLLHVAGRIVRSGRRVTLRLPRSWPWARALEAAFARLGPCLLRFLPEAAPPLEPISLINLTRQSRVSPAARNGRFGDRWTASDGLGGPFFDRQRLNLVSDGLWTENHTRRWLTGRLRLGPNC